MKFFIYALILFIPNFLWADYLESYKKLEKKYNFDRESYKRKLKISLKKIVLQLYAIKINYLIPPL